MKQARAATLCLINRERTRRGMGLVHSQTRLRNAATKHSRAMVSKGFFDHSSPAGSTAATRVRAAGYLRGAASFQLGENIGAGESALATPAAMVDAWMHSAGHRYNILHRSFRDIGIGIVMGTPMGVGRRDLHDRLRRPPLEPQTARAAGRARGRPAAAARVH